MSPFVPGIQLSGVVVAFDGSPTSQVAAEWAADTAEAYRLPLTLLRARPDAEGELVELEIGSDAVTELLGAESAEAIDTTVRRVRALHPDLELHLAIHPGSPVDALLDVSGSAELIAMGSRGLEGFRGLILGSTTMHVAPRAKCTVVVLYQPDQATAAAQATAAHPNKVVVGYDGSVSADLALAFALRHAEASGRDVAVILVSKGRPEQAAQEIEDVAQLDEDTQALVRSAEQVHDIHPEVPVRYLHGVGNPAGILIQEGSGAALAVVGARGRGGFAGLVLGSVGLQMLIHAECPVAVVHSTPAD